MDNETNRLIPELRFPEFGEDGGWEEKSFEELFEIGNGRDYKHLEKGDIPVYGSGGYMLSVNDYLYNGESVCIGRKGTIDKPMFLIGKFWTVDTLFYTHSFKDCLPKYIHYVFQNIDWLKHNEAGGIPSLSKTNIYKIKTIVPEQAEQQKIAECLSSLDELIAAHSQKLSALKDHKKGLMQNLFPQEGETVPKYRFPEFEKDGEWAKKTLGEVCEMQAGKFVNASEIKSQYSGGLFPCYGGNGLRGYTKSFTHTGKFSLIGRQGALCGNVMLADSIFHATEHAVVVTPKKKNDTVWLYYELELLNLNQYATGQAQPGLSVSNLEKLKLNIPENPEEQQKIGDCLSSLDVLITVQSDKIEQLKFHKKGLMQGLFPKTNH